MATNKDISSTLKHALIYSASGILAKAIGFIMLPVYAHYLRGEGYGIIGMIDVVLSMVTLLIGYGVQGAMSRFYYEKTTDKERNGLISTAIILMFFMVLSVSLPVLLFNDQIAWLAFGKTGLGYYIALAIMTFIADMTARAAETYILIRQKSVFYVFLSLLKLILGLSLNIYLIVYLELGVLGYLYSGLVVGIVFTIILHSYALFNTGLHFLKTDAKEILRFSLPLLPGYIAMFIRTNTNRVLLRTFLGLTQLGAFEMIFKFATLIGLFVVEPFSKIWAIKRFEIADTKDGPATMSKIFTLQLVVMLFVGLILSVEIPVILKILTPKEFWLSGGIAALAVLSRIILASYYHFFFGLLYAKKTYKISMLQWIIAAVYLCLAFLLIKPYGIYGAVIASCLTHFIQCGIAFKMATPYYKIPFEWNKIFVMLGFTIFLFFIIDIISITEIAGLGYWLKQIASKPIEILMLLFHLDAIKDGKLVTYTLGNIPLLVDGGVKFLLSFLFIAGLIAGNVIPREKFFTIIKTRSFKSILNS